MPSNYKLEDVIHESSLRAQQLESVLLGSVAWKPDSDSAMIFVVHKELGSRLHYGLVSNINVGRIKEMLNGTQDVTSTFRDKFMDSHEGFVAGLIQRMQRAKEDLEGSLVMVGFDAKQGATEIRAFQGGRSVKVPKSLEGLLTDERPTEKPSEGLKKRLAAFRALVGTDDVGCYLLARLEPRLPNVDSRRREPVELFGLGVLALPGSVIEAPAETERLPSIAINAERWMDTSKLATLTLFRERERYYEKAVRQAAQGWMLK